QCGAKRHSGDCHRAAQGVVRETSYHIEPSSELRNVRKISFLGGRRIGADTLQQDELAASPTAGSSNGIRDLPLTAHSDGNDERLSRRRTSLDERNVQKLKRCDLVGRGTQGLEQFDRGLVERRREYRDPDFPCPVKQRLMPLPRRVRLLV